MSWDTQTVVEVAMACGNWFSTRVGSPETVAAYAADLGLPYVLALDPAAGQLAIRETQRAFGVRLRAFKPGKRNTTWHLSLFPWLAARGIHPWSGEVCKVIGLWGEQLAGFGSNRDHVWKGDAQRTEPLSAAFIRRRAAAIRAYYRWHYAAGLTECSPADIWHPNAAGVPQPPAFRCPPEDLEREDLARLQLAADAHTGVAGDAELTSAVVAVLIETACRSIEVGRFDVRDYRAGTARRGAMLQLHPKGLRAQRWVPISKGTAERINRWLLWRPDLQGDTVAARLKTAARMPHAVPLFTQVRGARGAVASARREQEGHAGRLADKAVWKLLRRCCQRAEDPAVRELAPWIHPHGIRAAVATDLLDNDVEIHHVAALLGHSSLTTTAKYDRRMRDRQLPAASKAAARQALALEEAHRRALVTA